MHAYRAKPSHNNAWSMNSLVLVSIKAIAKETGFTFLDVKMTSMIGMGSSTPDSYSGTRR